MSRIIKQVISRQGHSVGVSPPDCKHTLTASVKCGKHVVQARLSHDGSFQHTVKWAETIKLPVLINGKPAVLLPGEVNLYKYPKVEFTHLRKGKAIVPSLEALYVVEELLRACLLDEDETKSLAFQRDLTGSTPLHGLLVANTKPSLSLALSIYKARPTLLLQAHIYKLFLGENALHILAVNRREEQLIQCVELAAAHLTKNELQDLFCKQATGIFFSAEPMAYYGGTPVNFAVAFSLADALRTMLRCSKAHEAMSGVIDFNDPVKAACKVQLCHPICGAQSCHHLQLSRPFRFSYV